MTKVLPIRLKRTIGLFKKYFFFFFEIWGKNLKKIFKWPKIGLK